jgi:hypothetical protein
MVNELTFTMVNVNSFTMVCEDRGGVKSASVDALPDYLAPEWHWAY